MRLHGELLELRDRNSIRCHTTTGAWTRRWKHWDRRSAAEWEMLSSETDMPYVRAFKPALYECNLSELIALLLVKNVQPEV